MSRYLTYSIDKHQSSPSFRNDIPDWLKENCDAGLDVVVDLFEGRRYFDGQWEEVSSNVQHSRHNGAAMIVAERMRQVTLEGFTPEHDDQHTEGELALASLSYIWSEWIPNSQVLKMYWPWDAKWWKPSSRIRNLVKAGALIAAEIDRLLRKGEQS